MSPKYMAPIVQRCAGGDFKIALLFVGAFAEKREDARQRHEEDEPDNKVRMRETEPREKSKPGQPKPR